MHHHHQPARRAFLQRVGQRGGAGAATPWALTLAAMGGAAAFTANDYRALVCVFLYGGNDHGNTLIPSDATGYAEYAKVRGGLAFARSALNATQLAPTLNGGRQYALAPSLSALKPFFDAGQLAVQLNVGPLVQPTTLAQYKARAVPLPPKLFSHNDQQSVWQSAAAEGAVRGWGGAMGDLAQRDLRTFMRFGMRPRTNPVSFAERRHGDEVTLEGVEIEHQCRGIDLGEALARLRRRG